MRRHALLLVTTLLGACGGDMQHAAPCVGRCCPSFSTGAGHAGHTPSSTPAESLPSAPATCMVRRGTFDGQAGLTFSTAWSPIDDFALSGAMDEIRLLRIDPDDGTISLRATYGDQPGRIYVRWSPDGAYALSVAAKDVRLLAITRDLPSIRTLARYDERGPWYGVEWSPSGSHALVTGNDGKVRLLAIDLAAPVIREVARFSGHHGKVLAGVWSPDGKVVLTGGEDRTTRLLSVDLDAGELIERKTLVDDHQVSAAAFHPSGQAALIGTWVDADEVTMLGLAPGSTELDVRGIQAHHASGVCAMTWTADGRYVITAGHDDAPKLFATSADLRTLEAIDGLDADCSGVHELSWSGSGDRFLVTASRLDRVTLIDVRGCL